MNIPQLEYALLLRKTGSFSIAARHARLTQSAISQQITKLEKEMGFIIFNRQSKPIQLTEDGEKFLDKAQIVLMELNQLKDFALELEEEIKGSLIVGIIPTLSPYLTPLFINQLNEQFPELKLTIKELMTEEIARGIIERELNAGIIATPLTTSLKFRYERLFYEKFHLYVSHKHPLYHQEKIALTQIEKDELWLLNEGNCFSDQVANMCDIEKTASYKTNLKYECNSLDALRRIVEHKGGLTFLPELATLNVPADQEDMIKEIKGKVRAREISLIFTKGEPKIHLIQTLSNIIRSNVPPSILEQGKKLIVDANIVV